MKSRQIGKSYIIREVGNRLYKNFVEVNFVKDDEEDGLFRDIHRLNDVGMLTGRLYEYNIAPVMKDERTSVKGKLQGKKVPRLGVTQSVEGRWNWSDGGIGQY